MLGAIYFFPARVNLSEFELFFLTHPIDLKSLDNAVFLEWKMGKGQLRDHDSLGNSDLSHVTSIGEVVITRAHVTVLPRLLDAETRRVA